MLKKIENGLVNNGQW